MKDNYESPSTAVYSTIQQLQEKIDFYDKAYRHLLSQSMRAFKSKSLYETSKEFFDALENGKYDLYDMPSNMPQGKLFDMKDKTYEN